MDFKQCIQNDFNFLFSKRFKIISQEGDSDYDRNIILSDSKFGDFIFISEKGCYFLDLRPNVSDGTKKRSYDFFYIVKLLYPKMEFADIKFEIFKTVLKDRFDDITSLFDANNIDSTTQKINDIISDYDKSRWKKT